ncbi:MAG: hypothetical protein N3A66_12335, partial [Planctomycetota bacterium]|nr:hypothetical protein [Planctomycetota bacterium]
GNELFPWKSSLLAFLSDFQEHFLTRVTGAIECLCNKALLTYNLWNLFLRLLEPRRHMESFQGRRWFLLIAARLVKSGGAKVVKISVADDWLQMITDGYRRVCAWLKATAPQLGWKSGWRRIPAFAGGLSPP